MPFLSKGVLKARPMRITTTAKLQQIQTAMGNIKPSLSKVTRGWGSIYDDDTPVGLANTAVTAGEANIFAQVNSTAGKPFVRAHETLAARLYWYRPVPSIRKILGPGAKPAQYSRLVATDVLISPILGSADFTLVVTSLDVRDVNNIVIPALSTILRGIDKGATINTGSSVIDFGSDDFFLWLVHHHLDGLAITGDLTIDDMYKVSVHDALDHETSIARGVTAGRLELLALLADPNKSFGPAQILISSAKLNAHIDFDLELDGSFTIHNQSTHYSDNTIRSKVDEHLLITQDLVHVILPAMKETYQRDTAWHATDRIAYRNARKAEAAAAMARL
jgi:hypothetical protein